MRFTKHIPKFVFEGAMLKNATFKQEPFYVRVVYWNDETVSYRCDDDEDKVIETAYWDNVKAIPIEEIPTGDFTDLIKENNISYYHELQIIHQIKYKRPLDDYSCCGVLYDKDLGRCPICKETV